jgi:DNA polymerase I-like protein with 3'-5' exonuclease and polymerase domains
VGKLGKARSIVSASKVAKSNGWLQTPLFAPEITWKATPVAQLPSWAESKRICLDVECRDDNLHELGPGVRRGGYVCGIAFAIEGGPAHYLPIRHEGGGNLSEQSVWEYLRDQARAFSGEFVFNSAPYDLDYLWQNGVQTDHCVIRDVQVAEPLLDELQKKYGLDAICARRGLLGKDEKTLRDHAKAWGVDPKTGLWRLHAGAVGAYAIGDVVAPLPLLRLQEKEIEEQKLRETYDLESAVTPALVRMTRRGIRVDRDELDRVDAWATGRLNEYIDRIHNLTGIRIGSISNAEEVGRALKKHGVEVPTKIHGGTGKQMYSVQKLWLQQQTDEVSKAVITAREFAKLKGTYVGGFRKHLVKDRLHPSFKQLVGSADEDEDNDEEGDSSGARFGRVAAKHPNVQAQMKRSRVIEKRWRKVLVPDEGKRWFRADLGQQEPRLTVHFAEICRLPGSMQAGNAFRDDPCFDPYQLMVELCKTDADMVGDSETVDKRLKQLREELKEVYLGRCYGMGGGKLARKLKLPTEWKTNPKFNNGQPYEAAGPEAQEKINRFDLGVPYVKALARMCAKSAKAKKYIIALGNRRVRFELDENGEIRDEHKALNKLIQGSGAHQTKTALVNLDKEGFPLQLTVHDEFGYSGDSEDEARRMGEITCNSVVIRVPFRCDIEAGSSYGDLKKLFTVSSKHTLLSMGA